MAQKFPVSEELQITVEQNKHIDTVYFTADGEHHFRVFKNGDKYYTRLQEVPETTKTGIQIPNKWKLEPILNYKGECEHEIVADMSREQVLAATPVRVTSNKPQILKADILDVLGISEDELQKLLKTKK